MHFYIPRSSTVLEPLQKMMDGRKRILDFFEEDI